MLLLYFDSISTPFKKSSITRKEKPATCAFCFKTISAAAAAVPPVANKSS